MEEARPVTMPVASCSKVVVCPYSDAHKVPAVDFFLHIAACRREYCKRQGDKLELRRCKFNGCHFLPAPELAFHEGICHSAEVYKICEEKLKYPPVCISEEAPKTAAHENLKPPYSHDLNALFDP